MQPGEYAIYTIHVEDIEPMKREAVRYELAKAIGGDRYVRQVSDTALAVDRLPVPWRGPAEEARWRRMLYTIVRNASVRWQQTYDQRGILQQKLPSPDDRPCHVYILGWRWRPLEEGGPAWHAVS